jgi:hypothetical protein
MQNDVGLKMKFHSLCHGPSTERGQRSKYEEKAKKIQKKIQNKSKMIVFHFKLIKEDKECFFDNSSSTSPFKKKYKLSSAIGRTKMKFKNEIFFTMKNDIKAAKQRYKEKINLLQTIFFGINSTYSFKDPLLTPNFFL